MTTSKTTVVPPRVDAVLVIGGSPELCNIVRVAAGSVHEAIEVHRCDFLCATSEATKMRPIAIAMDVAAYAFETPISLLLWQETWAHAWS